MKTKRIPKYLLFLASISIFQFHLFAQQHEIIIDENVRFTAVTPIDGTDEVVVISEDNGNEEEVIIRLDPDGNITWNKYLNMPSSATTGFGANLIVNNHRIAYDKVNDVLLIAGQNKDAYITSSGPAAYVILDGSNGNLLKQKNYNISPGNLISTEASRKYGFFVVGEEGNKSYTIIARVDHGNSSNNWQKRRSISGAYLDVAIDDGAEAVVAVGFDNSYALIDVYNPNTGNLNYSASFSYNGPGGSQESIRADVVESIGNGRFLITGHSASATFMMMFHHSNSAGQPYWVEKVEVDEIVEITRMMDGNVAFMYRQGNGENNFGVAKMNLNGEIQWALKYDKNDLDDVVALENKGLAILAFDNTNEDLTLIFTDQSGKSGCDNNHSLTIADMTLNKISTSPNQPDNESVSNYTYNYLNTPSISPTVGGCCWFAYDPFPGRTTWMCDQNPTPTLDADPLGVGYSSFLWTSSSGNYPNGSTTQVVNNIDTSSFLQFISVTVTDANGCEGWDRVPLMVVFEEKAINFDKAFYCQNTSSPVYLPTLKDYNTDYEAYSSFEDASGNSILDNDLTNYDNLAVPLSDKVYEMIDEKVFNPGCLIKRDFPYEVISCTCTTSTANTFDLTSWKNQFGEIQYGTLIPSGPGANQKIVRYRFLLLQDACIPTPASDPAHILQEEMLENKSSGSINYLVPVMSGRKLTGWASTPLSAPSTDHNLLLEVWYTKDVNYPYTICGYHNDELPCVDVARRANPEDIEDDGNYPGALEEERSFIIFPNPSNNIFTISRLQPESKVEIYSIQNKLIATSVTDGNGEILVDLEKNPAGVYIFIGLHNNKQITGKLIKH